MKSKESKISTETSIKFRNILDSIMIDRMLVPFKSMKIYKRREKRLQQLVKKLISTIH